MAGLLLKGLKRTRFAIEFSTVCLYFQSYQRKGAAHSTIKDNVCTSGYAFLSTKTDKGNCCTAVLREATVENTPAQV